MASQLVSCEWLKEQLDEKTSNMKILDGMWSPPAWKRDVQQEYLDKHIEGAVKFDIAEFSDKTSSTPLMILPQQQFEEKVGKMGINNDTHVVVYDNNPNLGFYSTGRVWWMFKTYGHNKISILDGGLPMWIAKGYPTVSGPQQAVSASIFKANYRPELYRTMEQMKENFTSKKEQVVDARPKGMFDGTAPDPSPKLHSGHILGSINFPFTNVVDTQNKKLKDTESLKQAFESAGVDLSKPLVLMCGGGMVSPLVTFALSLIGIPAAIYDGSWMEWAKNAPADTMHIGAKGEDLNK